MYQLACGLDLLLDILLSITLAMLTGELSFFTVIFIGQIDFPLYYCICPVLEIGISPHKCGLMFQSSAGCG